jgi:hypothetical protein
MTENTLTGVRRILGALSAEDQDDLGRWLAQAATRAGITDKGARLRLQAELVKLLQPGRP